MDSTKTKQRVTGTVRGDVIKELPVGTKMQFQGLPITPVITAGVSGVHNWDIFEGSLLAVQFKRGDTNMIMGSAILVGPGVALAAWHVVQSEIDDLMQSNAACILTGIGKDNHLHMWAIHKVSYQSTSDITILTLHYIGEMPKTNMFRVAPMSTRMPRLGERVMICGFRGQTVEEGKESVVVRGSVLASTGTVTQLCPNGRDSHMLPSACFEVDTHAVGSMSGGPVYDEQGWLIGLLSTSLECDGKGPSWVSSVWPALIREIEPTWPPGAYQKMRLINMSNKGCIIENPEAISPIDGKDLYDYRVWS